MQIIRRAEDSAIKESAITDEILQKFKIGHGGEEADGKGSKGGFACEDYGLAVDIGTTTIAISLYQLKEQRLVGSIQERNRQTLMGSDVVMRLMHCRQGNQKKLQQMVTNQIEAMAELLCDTICSLGDIRKITVVGNSTMCHIFAGKDTSGLAGSPFQPAYQGALQCLGSDVGFQGMCKTEIYILSGIGAHVGADTTAMLTCLEMFDDKKLQLAIDIGTNAEIVLNHSGKLVVCSVPAGPAFEGMEISCGMRGGEGAIAGVRLAPQAGNVILHVIGGDDIVRIAPKGICGSGLIDAVAQLLQYGLIRSDGYMLTAQEARENGIPEEMAKRLTEEGFLLFQSNDVSILLTQQDIRQFQLAKAAVQAGIKVLLSSQGLSVEQMEQIWIAGVFGGHISENSAIKTGLFPNVPSDRLSMAGNAAGRGAALALLSPEFCSLSENLAGQAEHLELASSDLFKREFLAAMELSTWK